MDRTRTWVFIRYNIYKTSSRIFIKQVSGKLYTISGTSFIKRLYLIDKEGNILFIMSHQRIPTCLWTRFPVHTDLSLDTFSSAYRPASGQFSSAYWHLPLNMFSSAYWPTSGHVFQRILTSASGYVFQRILTYLWTRFPAHTDLCLWTCFPAHTDLPLDTFSSAYWPASAHVFQRVPTCLWTHFPQVSCLMCLSLY